MTAAATANLEAAFRRIAETRMAGLAIVNSALEVEAVGFRPWQYGRVGVLITPWFMNLVWLPDDDIAGPRVTAGSAQTRALPGGEFLFLAAEQAGIGPYLSCSLISPMTRFADMDSARAVAEAVMSELFRPLAAAVEPAGLSRRGFLSALLPGERRP
jgi:[NiFe] hydrogenase assembly HybE family chaperone